MDDIKYRENVTTIRTVEKITLRDGKVQKRELHEKPTEHSETDWFNRSYFCTTNGDQFDFEKAYQESCEDEKPDISEEILIALFDWVADEIGDYCSIPAEVLLDTYKSERQLLKTIKK